ncbi:EI24 domain-containing protein [Aquicoccus sp. G2-2]|uniref:EI24 domain-containing protein n=1 Tax=Aquicoccus sp. G2-2 TaxID=3092120 RepID=UPI002AE01091|nr:EI24 domain-containing protein [Aquicoccus sp. G2-2]MEA1112179.1 EI24 domain-containing protein [Aquicoccus sp. G2-2]
MIFNAFFKAIAQIGDPRFRKVFFLGIGLTFVLLIAAYAALLWVIDWLSGPDAYLAVLGRVEWLGDLVSLSSFFFMLFLSFFLMIPVASAITSLFLDEVAQAVEDRHFPALPPVPKQTFYDALRDTVNFLGVLIGANLLAVMLYVFFPLIAPIIFFGLNGFLLGREYFQLAAMRRIGRKGAKELRARHRGTIWLAGTLMALPLTVPVLNLFIPILGAATFTHIFHGLERR